jgi:hypothetical protein
MTTNPDSHYAGKPESEWESVTEHLLANHPLKEDTIRSVAEAAWGKLWETTVGSGRTAIRLAELDVPAMVAGYFFEQLFAREMQCRFPGKWRGTQGKDEKDLYYIPDPKISIEVKTSGQLGLKVYGNRSYGQQLQNEQLAKKEKSGFYITVNFFRGTLTLLRFGWIDASDWMPQASPTGQMAGLPDSVYRHKLRIIRGSYRLQGPVGLLEGIGDKTSATLEALGIVTIGDLLNFRGTLPARVARIRDAARLQYQIT